MRANHLATAATLFLLAPAAWAQTSATATRPAADAAPSKLGILSLRQGVFSTAEGKQASAELQSQFAPRQSELENLRKQVQDLQNRLQTGERTLSDEEKARLTRQGDQLSRQFQRKQDELRDDANNAENEVFDRIGRKMMDVLDRYVRENGYAVVFDVSSQTNPVLYAAPQVDITVDIVRLYDQANPVKGATQPPAQPGQRTPPPGQVKPPQQQPPPKPPQR